MAAKSMGAGSEVDAYCTKCRMDLAHRVVALVGDVIKRVECLTCSGQHNYRAPKAAVAPARIRASGAAGRAPSAPRVTTTAKRAAAESAEAERRRLWERAIAGRSPNEFRAYRMTESYGEGELVHHGKFGDGVVSEVVDGGKVEILFAEGPRRLAHGLPAA
ncbi:MAG: hypothetical protein HY908_22530 [Myxococcales bacterium]|nr:hypothetical protein [Myxococcales bacterium]